MTNVQQKPKNLPNGCILMEIHPRLVAASTAALNEILWRFMDNKGCELTKEELNHVHTLMGLQSQLIKNAQ